MSEASLSSAIFLAHRAFLETVGELVGQAIPALATAIAQQIRSPVWNDLWADMTSRASGYGTVRKLDAESRGTFRRATPARKLRADRMVGEVEFEHRSDIPPRSGSSAGRMGLRPKGHRRAVESRRTADRRRG